MHRRRNGAPAWAAAVMAAVAFAVVVVHAADVLETPTGGDNAGLPALHGPVNVGSSEWDKAVYAVAVSIMDLPSTYAGYKEACDKLHHETTKDPDLKVFELKTQGLQTSATQKADGAKGIVDIPDPEREALLKDLTTFVEEAMELAGCKDCKPKNCGAHGTFNPATCECDCTGTPKWRGELCDKCDYDNNNDSICQHGSVLDRATCSCTGCAAPWSGQLCQDCTVKKEHCKNGFDLVQDGCVCDCQSSDQWGGTLCDTCKVTEEICKGKDHATKFDAANCKCICDETTKDFFGNADSSWDCSDCILVSGTPNVCKHGTIADAPKCECKCDDGWKGAKCDTCKRTMDDCVAENTERFNDETCQCECKAGVVGDEVCGCKLTQEDCNASETCKSLNKNECRCVPEDSAKEHADRWSGNAKCTKCNWSQTDCLHVEKNGAGIVKGLFNDQACECQNCPEPWKGLLCDTCGHPASYCGVNGSLDGINCKCDCHDDWWVGAKCETCTREDSDCEHGKINKKTCMCEDCDNWTGPLCEVCSIARFNEEGEVVSHDCANGSTFDKDSCSCTCNEESGLWKGKLCDDCSHLSDEACFIRGEQYTMNQGTCSCSCNDGNPWTGPKCDACSISADDCNGGKFIASQCDCDCTGINSGKKNNRVCQPCEKPTGEAANKCESWDDNECACKECKGDWGGASGSCDRCMLEGPEDCGGRGSTVSMPSCTCECKAPFMLDEGRCKCPDTGTCDSGSKWDTESCSCKCPIIAPKKGEAYVINIGLVMDLTFSMGDWVQKAKDTFASSQDKVLAGIRDRCGQMVKLDVRYGAVGYRDKVDKDDEFMVVPFGEPTDVIEKMKSWSAKGGGDVPEDVEGGLQKAAELTGWDQGDINFVVFVADAPCHGKWCGWRGEEYPPGMQAGLQALKNKCAIFTGFQVNSMPKMMFKRMMEYYNGLKAPATCPQHIEQMDLIKFTTMKINAQELQDEIAATVTKAVAAEAPSPGVQLA